MLPLVHTHAHTHTHTHTHTHPFNGRLSGLPGWASSRKVKPIWISLKQETVSGSDISWDICKSAPRSRQITMPTPHHSVFYRPDALPATQPTASKHWRQVPLVRLQWVVLMCQWLYCDTFVCPRRLSSGPATEASCFRPVHPYVHMPGRGIFWLASFQLLVVIEINVCKPTMVSDHLE